MNQLSSLSQKTTKVCFAIVAGIASTVVFSSPIHAATLGQNLIVNGDAEQGEGDPIGNAVGDDIPFIPIWNTTGDFSVLQYGATGFEFTNAFGNVVLVRGLPDADSPGPSDRGNKLFYGGGERASSSASQLIDLTSLSSIIDASRGAFNLSGWLGGYTDDEDNAKLEITFLNQANQPLGIANIASPTAAERNNITGLSLQSVDGFVPVGTRQVNVLLNMNHVRGRVNDAYADNLTLVITKVPEPSVSGLFLVGASCIMAWQWSKKHRVLQ
ncbi:PEP-CTERM sorting domain-containing protein [Nostocaceae cyanobacterium CENA357]|uniref:PEP-CTERM sorting domain-containing protein n=1 Tax=Atlanticothrix silvestris CENA357 TaxID=1725252 RepID=A0A8J7KWZ1_9CYAN|nr:PEP-CTERM sorting domain-containing protein [Atlanticothrix silvestris]MBH8551690.1 PEP-CTERM sorting domain-containing protein [Atlanticothrix silvestris CENA357]